LAVVDEAVVIARTEVGDTDERHETGQRVRAESFHKLERFLDFQESMMTMPFAELHRFAMPISDGYLMRGITSRWWPLA